MCFNYIGILIMMFVFWTIGMTLVKSLKLGDSYNCFYMVTGACIVSIISSLLYFRLNISIAIISVILAVFSVALFAIQARNRNITKNDVTLYAVEFVIFLVLIIPGVIRGTQYYVYRGNFWDQYNYISEAITAYDFPWRYIVSNGPHISDDVYRCGVSLLTGDRPSVTIVFSLLLLGKKGSIFLAAYLYHCMFLSMVFPPMFSVIRYVSKQISECYSRKYTERTINTVAGMIAIIYVLGFYGQIQYDINAWSHLCTIAIFASNLFLFLRYFEDAENGRASNNKYICNINLLVLMNVVMLGGFLYYVENWSVQYAISCISILIICMLRKYKVSLMQIISIILIPMVSVLVGGISCPQVIRFLIHQFDSSVVGTVSYGDYWTNWMYGFWTTEGIANSARVPAFLVSIFGMPICVPWWGKGSLVVYAWMLILFVVFALLVFAIGYRVVILIKNKIYTVGEQFLSIWMLISLLVGAAILIKTREYAFAKYVLYTSPYIWMLISLPLLYVVDFTKGQTKEINIINKLCKLVVCALAMVTIFSNVAFLGLRVVDTIKNDKANGFNRVYPSDQDPGLKHSHVFNLDMDKIGDAEIIQIEEEFPFYLYYMKISLLYADKQYYCSENHVHYESEDVTMKKPDHIDMLIKLEENEVGRLEPVYTDLR